MSRLSALKGLRRRLADTVATVLQTFKWKVEFVDVVILDPAQLQRAWSSTARLGQCLIFSDPGAIECVRPEGEQ